MSHATAASFFLLGQDRGRQHARHHGRCPDHRSERQNPDLGDVSHRRPAKVYL